MEGRAIARPNHLRHGHAPLIDVYWLQWRAGQLPGQTSWLAGAFPPTNLASMEGRAIARPNPEDAVDGDCSSVASMEGRAIARPNPTPPCTGFIRNGCFNGGPGNCPAKPGATRTSEGTISSLQWRAGQLPGQTPGKVRTASDSSSLQWRAGQLPGQTLPPGRYAKYHTIASMEGRAIVRPNCRWGGGHESRGACFNGGPGNCPAKPS